MKEIYTTVKVNDREFTIKKFDARTGLKIARLLMAKAAPLLPVIKENGVAGDEIFGYLSQVLNAIDDKDLDMLIDYCLRVCSERLPAGLQPVIDENGYYGVEDLEYDMPLTLKLCIEAIKWGAADFFGENGLNLSLLTN